MSLKESFSQIQKVLNAISKDKLSSGKFAALQTLEEKFDFSQQKCKDLSMSPIYNLEELEKFLLFTNALYELNNGKDLLKEFSKADDVDKMYEIVKQQTNKVEASVQINKMDFEAFIQSLTNKIKKIPPDSLDSVSGGDAVDDMLGHLNQGQALFGAGQLIGNNLKILGGLIKKH